MKILIEQVPADQPEELLIRCHEASAAWVTDITTAAVPQASVVGKKDNASFRLPLKDICYFEVVDGKSFLYSDTSVYETKLKLYEFEDLSKRFGFFRSGKSMVLNAYKINSVTPSFSGRFTAALLNGEKVIVSRQYVAELKNRMGL